MAKRLPRSRTLKPAKKDDPKLVYYDSAGGHPGEPPLLLLHGATLRAEDWENIFPRLATRYRVIAYDTRGHGKSARAASYALPDLADDAAHVLREIAKVPAIVIGHSIGGATALVLAARHPELVKALVLEDPWLQRYHDGVWRKEGFTALQALMAKQGTPEFARAVGMLPLPVRGPRGERTVAEVRGFYSPERLATYYGSVDPVFVNELLRPEPAGTAAIAEAIEKVNVPTLVIAADQRVDSALAEGEPSALEVRGMQVLHFSGQPHRLHGIRPEVFLEAIEPFLRKHRAA